MANIHIFPGDVPSNPILPSDDINSILAEIELTRNTLAEVQALRLEVDVTNQHSSPVETEVNEESLTSEQWLEVQWFCFVVGIVIVSYTYNEPLNGGHVWTSHCRELCSLFMTRSMAY